MHRTIFCIVGVAALANATERIVENGALIVHEWGTFTSVAGKDGNPEPWTTISNTSDLPCFVERLSPLSPKSGLATIRMETPVLYFYASHATALSVHVNFPTGWITEWYPRATEVQPLQTRNPIYGEMRNGRIAWDNLLVQPGADLDFPKTLGKSRYYAARNTDASPLRVGSQPEKLLFYRGIGDFGVPIQASFDVNGSLELRSSSTDAAPFVIWFENRDGPMGYRVLRQTGKQIVVNPPQLNAKVEEIRAKLTDALVEFGLYPKEALAMLDTWQDSWFEAGSRLIYIVPRKIVDSVLPLQVTPAPDGIARVFVGRVEMLPPWRQQQLWSAVAARDSGTLAKSGRFLQEFLQQLGSQGYDQTIQAAFRQITQEARAARSCVE